MPKDLDKYKAANRCELQGTAGKDPEAVPNPDQFSLDRPDSAYIQYSVGPHACLGREISTTFVVSLIRICAGLKNLRPAPGDMGALKHIMLGTERCYLNDSWSYMTFDPTSKTLPITTWSIK